MPALFQRLDDACCDFFEQFGTRAVRYPKLNICCPLFLTLLLITLGFPLATFEASIVE